MQTLANPLLTHTVNRRSVAGRTPLIASRVCKLLLLLLIPVVSTGCMMSITPVNNAAAYSAK